MKRIDILIILLIQDLKYNSNFYIEDEKYL